MQAPDTGPTAPPRRDDAGTFKITDRDITGLALCAEQYGAPYDLLATALEVTVDRLRGIVARWRHAGVRHHRWPGTRPGLVLADPGRDAAPRPRLHRSGTVGDPARPHPRRPRRPPLAGSGELYQHAGVVAQRTPHPRRWRRPRRTAHLPDAEVHWPSLDDSPYGGQIWAIEAELTPKPLDRTVAIMRAMLASTSDYGAATSSEPSAQVWAGRLPDRRPP